MQLRKNDLIDMEIDSFGAQGEGVGRYEGLPIFVPYALPGERVRIRIVKMEKRYAFARVEEVLQSSPERIEPACPYYRQCGGCACLHMSYAAQMRFKHAQVEDCMRHIAGLDVAVAPVLGMETPWHYRNKISMPVAGSSEQPLIGYYAQRSHRVVDVKSCLLAHEDADRISAAVREWMQTYHISPYCEETHTGLVRHVMTRRSRSGELMAVLVINGRRLPEWEALLRNLRKSVPALISLGISVNQKRGNVILGESYQTLWGQERLQDVLCGNRFLLSPLSFFQINPEQTERLYAAALELADLHGSETVADVYCGAGTISLALAKTARHVTGIEIVPDAIRDARINAERNGISNAKFYCGAAEQVLPQLVREGLRPEVVVLDPPRKGADIAVLNAVLACEPKRIVYVSCNPATLARDARILSDGGYRMARCQPVDMFCQTAGIENAALFLPKS